MPQEAFFQKIDDWIQSQSEFWILKGVIFRRIIIRKVGRSSYYLKTVATGTLQVLEFMSQVQESLLGPVDFVVPDVSTYLTGNAVVHDFCF